MDLVSSSLRICQKITRQGGPANTSKSKIANAKVPMLIYPSRF